MTSLGLAWHYLCFYRVKTLIVVAALVLVLALPVTAHLLIRLYGEALTARADATPLVLGPRGNRFDVVLKSLYFRPAATEPIPAGVQRAVRRDGSATAIPLHLEFTAADGFPIVGTTLSYLDFRQLRLASGTRPLRIGQAVLGAAVAAERGLAVGDRVLSDQTSLYDLAATYPLRMEVVGVLAPTGTADDRAVIVDLKTAWIIAGYMHGHQDVTAASAAADVVLDRDAENVVASAALREYNEITPENLASFHLHADPNALPVSAVIVLPRDEKAATILTARYSTAGQPYRVLAPRGVIDELLGYVFQIRRIFDLNFALVGVAAALFLAVIVLLSVQLRRREFTTLVRLGAGRGLILRLVAWELLLIAIISVAVAAGLAAGVARAAPAWLALA